MAPLAEILALLAMAMATTDVEEITLDMAPYSFDDQYEGCGTNMTEKLPALKSSDFEQNKKFAKVWEKAAAAWQSQKLPVSPLSPDQAIAIMAYTTNYKYLYKDFNDAVRVAGRSRQDYQDNFHFKTLHFLLTQALKTLRDMRDKRDTQRPQCHNVYRGVDGVRFKAETGDIVRFGQFASTSQKSEISKDFGDDTVFHVHTCYGVGIWNFSSYPREMEVLIPPFETFEVIDVIDIGNTRRIHLQSIKTFSKYNCEWLKGDTTDGSVPRATFNLRGLLLATTALAVATGIL